MRTSLTKLPGSLRLSRPAEPRYNTVMNLDAVLPRLAADPAASVDLAEVALALARDEYPALDVDGYLAEFDAMAHEARRLIGSTFASGIAGLCRYLFHEAGFRGNRAAYYDPR